MDLILTAGLEYAVIPSVLYVLSDFSCLSMLFLCLLFKIYLSYYLYWYNDGVNN